VNSFAFPRVLEKQASCQTEPNGCHVCMAAEQLVGDNCIFRPVYIKQRILCKNIIELVHQQFSLKKGNCCTLLPGLYLSIVFILLNVISLMVMIWTYMKELLPVIPNE